MLIQSHWKRRASDRSPQRVHSAYTKTNRQLSASCGSRNFTRILTAEQATKLASEVQVDNRGAINAHKGKGSRPTGRKRRD